MARDKQTEITQYMPIEDVFYLVGGEAVKRYYSRPSGIAMYNDENYNIFLYYSITPNKKVICLK